MAITRVESLTGQEFKPTYSGFLGLAPYSMRGGASAAELNQNLLFQLNFLGKVRHFVFAVYVDNTYGAYSTIKLGSWDQIGLKNDTKL